MKLLNIGKQKILKIAYLCLLTFSSFCFSDFFTISEGLIDVRYYVKTKEYEKARLKLAPLYAEAPDNVNVKNYFKQLSHPDTLLTISSDIVYPKTATPVIFNPKVIPGTNSGAKWITSGNIKIFNELGATVKTIPLSLPFTNSVVWKIGEDAPLPEGNYFAEAEFKGALGYSIYSTRASFYLAHTPITALLSSKETLFAPGKEKVSLQINYPFASKVANYVLKITDNAGKIVSTITGKGALPSSVIWDGSDVDKQPVPGCDLFTIALSGKNVSGEEWNSNPVKIESALEIVSVGNQLTFKTSSLNFASGKSDISPSAVLILGRITQVLKKYNWYSIHIVGYTDNVGSSEANKTLSLQRAESVKNFLLSATALPPVRFSVDGKGMENPTAPNVTEGGRARNRRVEFVLTELPREK